MGEYDAKKRPLPWPLRDQLVQSRTTEEDVDCTTSSFVWPIDSDERVMIPFSLSLNEYVVLSSTIDVGSDIAYGDDAIRVKWLWNRNMRCDVDLCAAMINVLLTCEEFREELVGFIGNAIGNEPTVQQQIRDFITGDEFLNDYFENLVAQGAISPESQGRNMLKPGVCDSGYLFNQAFVTIDTLKTLSINVFSALSVGASAFEWAKLALTIMPIVGGIIPAATIVAFASSMVETLYTLYATEYTNFKDEIICDLWCRLEETCEMSLNDLIQYHIDKAGVSLPELPLDAFKEVVQIITTGGLTGSKPVYIMHLLMLTAMRLNQVMLGIDFASYAVSITEAGDTSNDGYLDCASCAPTGLWEVYPYYAGLGYDYSGQITAQTGTSVTFATNGESGGERRIIAFYNNFAGTVTVTSSSDPGAILAKYHGSGPSMFGGTFENDQLEAADAINYIYFTSNTGAFTLTITFTPD